MAKDRAAMERHLSADVVEIGPAFPMPLEGERDFFRRYRPYLEGALEVVLYRIVRPRAIPLGRDSVLVYFGYRMRTRAGGKVVESRGKESMLVRRSGAAWRVAFIHWHRD
jgi:hypothetical protein